LNLPQYGLVHFPLSEGLRLPSQALDGLLGLLVDELQAAYQFVSVFNLCLAIGSVPLAAGFQL